MQLKCAQSQATLYHFVCLAPHGPVEVTRASEVDQGQWEFAVRHHHDVNTTVLHMKSYHCVNTVYISTTVSDTKCVTP